MRAIVFPGQGSQGVGMGAGLFERHAALVEQADEVMGLSMRRLCLEDPDGWLAQTRYAQPAIFLVNALHWLSWVEDHGGEVAAFAGHSLGEYNALLAAGAFDFRSGLQIVKRRGELFARAGGGMAAVVGLPAAQLRALLEAEGLGELDLANLNSLEQTVLAGELAALARARERLEGRPGITVVPLKVSGAFHSRHMRPLKDEFDAFLQGFALADPARMVVSNVTARPYQPGQVAEHLVEQLDHPVRWRESVRFLRRQGVDDWLELGHGRVLTRLLQAIEREAQVPALQAG